MSSAVEDSNRRLLRARDAIDRTYAEELDVPKLAEIACVSEAHFIRSFRATFGETPHRYLQRRRVERAMFLLRETQRSVTDVSLDVGFTSLGTFSRTFREIVGVSPREYRAGAEPRATVPTCFAMAWTRPATDLPKLPVGAGQGLARQRASEAAVSEKNLLFGDD
jgi:AraC-like DNA-binding protein